MSARHMLHVRSQAEFGKHQFTAVNADADAEFVQPLLGKGLPYPEARLVGNQRNGQSTTQGAAGMCIRPLHRGESHHHAVIADRSQDALLLLNLNADLLVVVAASERPD